MTVTIDGLSVRRHTSHNTFELPVAPFLGVTVTKCTCVSIERRARKSVWFTSWQFLGGHSDGRDLGDGLGHCLRSWTALILRNCVRFGSDHARDIGLCFGDRLRGYGRDRRDSSAVVHQRRYLAPCYCSTGQDKITRHRCGSVPYLGRSGTW